MPELVEALDDPHNPAWFWALDALAAFGPEAIPVLLTLAGKFEPRSRHLSSIVDTFGNMGSLALPALLFLTECVRNEDSGLRCSAVNALGALRLRPDLVVPALISVLCDPEFLVRLAAINTIGRYGKEATPAVAELEKLLNDPDQFIREAATRALDRIGPSAAEG